MFTFHICGTRVKHVGGWKVMIYRLPMLMKSANTIKNEDKTQYPNVLFCGGSYIYVVHKVKCNANVPYKNMPIHKVGPRAPGLHRGA